MAVIADHQRTTPLVARWKCESCNGELTMPAGFGEWGYFCCYASMTFMGVGPCDSGSDPQGGDALAAPGEASQSGGAEGATSPIPLINQETPHAR